MRRTTLPLSTLETLVDYLRGTFDKKRIVRVSENSDALLLGLHLNLVVRKRDPHLVELTEDGVLLVNASEASLLPLLFQFTMRDNPTLPSFFRDLIIDLTLSDKKVEINQVAERLNISDPVTLDILVDWLRCLGLCQTYGRHTLKASRTEIKDLQMRTLVLLINKTYKKYAGPNKEYPVPFARVRSSAKRSGLLFPEDDFDEIFYRILLHHNNIDRVSFRGAPAANTGPGFNHSQFQVIGTELIIINEPLVIAEPR